MLGLCSLGPSQTCSSPMMSAAGGVGAAPMSIGIGRFRHSFARKMMAVSATRATPAGRAFTTNSSKFTESTRTSGGGGSGGNGRGPPPPGGSGGSGGSGSGDNEDLPPLPDLPGDSGRGRMKPLTIVFGLFVLVGGVMGYKKKRSKDSLVASSIIAGLLLFSAYLMGKPNTTYGIRLALVTTGSLAAYMGKGYYDKRKAFPQGVLAVMSSLMTIAYIGSL